MLDFWAVACMGVLTGGLVTWLVFSRIDTKVPVSTLQTVPQTVEVQRVSRTQIIVALTLGMLLTGTLNGWALASYANRAPSLQHASVSGLFDGDRTICIVLSPDSPDVCGPLAVPRGVAVPSVEAEIDVYIMESQNQPVIVLPNPNAVG